jgi:hypothetical protein
MGWHLNSLATRQPGLYGVIVEEKEEKAVINGIGESDDMVNDGSD